jgi:hypothetical protein
MNETDFNERSEEKMKLPTQMRPAAANYAAAYSGIQEGVRPSGILPSDCCDGTVTIYSPSGSQLYQGTSGCCYSGSKAYCYPCGGEQAAWETYAKKYFPQFCSDSTPCAISLTNCGSLTPYC